MITALGQTGTEGSPSANALVATVNDVDEAANILQIQISSDGTNFANTATLNGVTVTLTDSNAGATGTNPNETGQIFADVVAACGASNASFTLKVTDSAGAMSTASLMVTVNPNMPPVLSYGNQTVAYGNALMINPATGPSDNVSVNSIVVQSVTPLSAPGMLSVDNATGVVSVPNNVPVGMYTVTIRATDNCGGVNGMTDAVFTVTVAANTPPTISSVILLRTAGAGSSNSAIATVSDAEQAANTLSVTVNSAASTTLNGVTVSGLSIGAGGVLTANVAAATGAAGADFILQVTDNQGSTATATLVVIVTSPACSSGNVPFWQQQAKTTASDGVTDDNFGVSVSISGDTALVGAWRDSTAGGTAAGSAYVFTRSGGVWTQQQKLSAADGETNDLFGSSVALSGDTALIGASGDDAFRGSAYVFTRSGGVWTQQQKLTAADGALNDGFGNSVALSGNTALVGAWIDNTAGGTDAGSAYIFTHSGGTWTQQQKLTASDGTANDYFGYSVALSGETAMIGALADGVGSAYVFTRSSGVWTQQQKLTAADGAANDGFGSSVALRGDTALVGAYLDDTAGGTDAGSAYIFTRNGGVWTQQQKLTAPDGATNDHFGISAALSGDTALVGAWHDNTEAGSAYVFTHSGGVWTQQQKLTAYDVRAGNNFGNTVALSGDTALVGARQDGAGSSYVFNLLCTPPPTFGTYANTMVQVGSNTTITPDVAPTNVMNAVATAIGFQGSFTVDPTTGVVSVTNAGPAGTYTVTVRFFSSTGLSAMTSFTLTVTNPSACATPSFTGTTEVSVGSGPSSVAVGDFNGDGNQDLAVVSNNSSSVSIRLGNGLGGFRGTTEVSVGTAPTFVAIADFNGDGNQDLAVANFQSYTVSIRLGDGAGNFSGSTEVSVLQQPQSVAVGDFNGDGNQDFAVGSYEFGIGSNVSVALGDGVGNFSSSIGASAGTGPVSVAVSDFNGDGKLDLAVANYGSSNGSTVSIRLGDGGGYFGGTTDISVGTGPISVAVADFNGDAKQDLAVANINSNTVSIRLGDGAGNFSGTTNVSVGSVPRSVAVGDFNGDGKLDFATANYGSGNGNTVSIRLGDGTGNFSGTSDVSVGSLPASVAVGDFNEDGKLDLATANQGSNTASIRLGSCNLAPTITVGGPLTRQQGTVASNSIIATVSDASAGTLTVTATTVPTGISVTNINNSGGTVTADVATGCNAMVGMNTVVLTVTNGTTGLTNTANLTVNVTVNTPPLLTYNNASTLTGTATTVSPASGPTDNGSVSTIVVQSVTPSSAPGTITINNTTGVVSVPNNVPAGSYTVTVRATDNCGGAGGMTDAVFTLVVNRATPVITWNNPADIVYGTALSAVQLNATANVAGTFAYSPPLNTVLGAGDNQTLNVTFTPTDAANYQSAMAAVTINVHKAVLTVKAENKLRMYGAANPALTYAISGFVNNDPGSVVSGTPVLNTTATTASAVGDYPITVDVSGLSAANYSFMPMTGTLSVTRAPLTVKADDKAKVFGAPNPPFTASYNGFVNNEGPGVLGGALQFSTTAVQNSPIGAYPITPSGLTSTNYAISFVDGTLTVGTQLLTITAENKTKVYGAANPVFTVTYAGFVGSDGPASLGGTLTFATSATMGSNVGAYTITPGGLTSANYAIQFVNGTLTINKAPLAITTDNKTRLFGVANPPLTGTVTGVVNNDNITVIWGTTATINSPLGAYPITPVIADPDNRLGNYQVTQSNGVLTIACPAITFNPATLPNGVLGTAYNQTLTANPVGTTYSFSVTTGVLPPGLTLASNGALSGTPIAAGNYAFTVSATGWGGCTKAQNYNLFVTGTCAPITVNPATLPGGTLGMAYNQTVSATGGTAPYAFAVTQGALPPGLALNTNTGALTGTPTQGGSFSFRVTATGLGGCTGSRNYLVTMNCATLTFTPNALPTALRGVAYSQQLSVSTGGSPISNALFSVQVGSLPPGFSLSSTGLLSGMTTQTGVYNFTVRALTGTCQSTKAYALVINNSAAALAMSGDYDGDGKSDPALWSASDGVWRIVKSSDNQAVNQSWGTAGDLTLLGDYDGDGKSDLAVFRPTDATFYILKSGRSGDGSLLVKHWGLASDVPVPGDYDGDGKTDLAVWRGATGTWYVVRSSDGRYEAHVWGASEAPYQDVPVAGDYDGDGKSDVAVFRRGNSTWLIKRSSDGQYVTKQWGLGTDVPVAADYDGDGQTDIAVWRGGTWYIWQSALNAYRVTAWGTVGDQVGTGDYDGDGQADLAVWQPTETRWSFKCSSDGNLRQQTLGRSGDATVPRKP